MALPSTYRNTIHPTKCQPHRARAPIQAFLSPQVEFVSSTPQQQAFKKVAAELSNPRVLVYFDSNGQLHLETDTAQSCRLGVALWQQQHDSIWHLLHCRSRRLSDTESRNSATEIELLVAVWAVNKRNNFLAGITFELAVDHWLLVSIINTKTIAVFTTHHLTERENSIIIM